MFILLLLISLFASRNAHCSLEDFVASDVASHPDVAAHPEVAHPDNDCATKDLTFQMNSYAKKAAPKPPTEAGVSADNKVENAIINIEHINRVVSYQEQILKDVNDQMKVKEDLVKETTITLVPGKPRVVVFKYHIASKIHFKDMNPRNLTLLFEEGRVYVAMALLIDRFVNNKPSSTWVCSNSEYDEWEVNKRRVDFYFSRYSGIETYDFLLLTRLAAPKLVPSKISTLKTKLLLS